MVVTSTATAVSAKKKVLHDLLTGMGDVVVAVSGGVDSTFLMAAAHDALSGRALGVTAVSPSLPRRERDEVTTLASRLGWNHRVVSTREVEREEYARNSADRCYWCKTELFDVIAPIARRSGATILVGTNADDRGDFRPGKRAAREHGVRAPLVEAELSKDEIRLLSRAMGLPTADKPAGPCLASRFAYGVRVTEEGLRRIDEAEEFLRALGFVELRVRDHGQLARIEVPSEEVTRAAGKASEIAEALKSLGWKYVTLDLQGFRSGSLNEVLQPPRISHPDL